MHILDGKSHDMLLDYLRDRGNEAMHSIDARLDAVGTLDEWELLKRELINIYKSAYPTEMFAKRPPLRAEMVSEYRFERYRVENYLFESFPGWYVNATVYIPLENGVYPGIVCPTGHSSKKYPNYTGSAQLLAQSGYIAVSFDPPGMQGEHQTGNDHFEDGVRGYLSGFWSQSFFVMDAIRCMDYLETRSDVLQGKGFGMTGISGGGTTTIHTAILDSRLACIAPVCCISDEEGVMFRDRYTFCPEERGVGHIKGGIKYRTLISLFAPLPCLIVAGKKDEVFNSELAQSSVKKTEKFYSLCAEGNIDIFIDDNAGHEYSPVMVSRVAAFFDKHLKPENEYFEYSYTINDIQYPEHEKLLCHPKDTTSMYTKNLERFDKTERGEMPGADEIPEMMGVRQGQAEVVHADEAKVRWAHRIEKQIFVIHEKRKIPAIVLERNNKVPKNILIHADERGKWRGLENDGYLARSASFLDRVGKDEEYSVLSVDLSGFGELSMDPGEYDIAAWSRTDRLLGYISIALGTSIMGIRTEELLGVLNYIHSTGRYADITVSGTGEAALAVLAASYIFGKCKRVVLEGLPVSFRSIAEHIPSKFCPASIIYNAPEKFEIFEMVNNSNNVTLINPVYGDGKIVSQEYADKIYSDNVNILFNDHGLDEKILEVS